MTNSSFPNDDDAQHEIADSDALLSRLASIDQEELDMAILEVEPDNTMEPEDPEGFSSADWLEAEKREVQERIEVLKEV